MATLPKSKIQNIRYNPQKSGLLYSTYGAYNDISEYSDKQIEEMIFGLYIDKKAILADGDYIVELNDLQEVICELEAVTYIKKPGIKSHGDKKYNAINNIRTFYVKDYWLITEKEFGGAKKHKITNRLVKMKVGLRNGRNEFRGLYAIGNGYELLYPFDNGSYPKDLYHPIKKVFCEIFFKNSYHIRNFKVVGPVVIGEKQFVG